VAYNIFSIIITAFFPAYKNVYQSHALIREGQITVRFRGHSRIMGYQ